MADAGGAKVRIIEWENFLGASDLHGSHQNKRVVKAFFEFRDAWQPVHRFTLGDEMDITALRNGADDEDKATPLRFDINMGLEFLERFRPKHKLDGNHCFRLWRAAQKQGLVAELARKLTEEIEAELKKLGIVRTPYSKRRYVQFGDTKLAHGFAGGVGAARKMAMHYGRCIFGHIHAKDSATFGRAEQPVTAYSCPALLKLDADYNAGHVETLRQENGWVYGVINKRSGKTQIWQHVYGGPTMLPANLS